MYLTVQDIVNLNIRLGAPSSESDIFKELIEKDQNEERQEKLDGINYYTADNDIEDEDFTEYTDTHGNKANQTNKANNKLSHGFHRRQVIEKVSYLLKNPMSITFEDDSEDEGQDTIDKYTDVLGRKFQDTIIELSEGASNKGVEWLHFFFDGPTFDYMVTGSEGIIPIYETSKQKDLVNILRYFELQINVAGEESTVFSLEWWGKETVEFWEQEKHGGDFILKEERTHFTLDNKALNTSEDASWGEVPFVPLLNNNQKKSDLHFIKSLVDAYDKQVSLSANDLEDLQEAILIAVGTSDEPADIRDNVMKFKVIVLPEGEGSSLTALTVDIPTEAKRELLDRLENNIAAFGMATNHDTEIFGNNPSGVALKALFIPLDLKAGMLERKLIDVFYRIFWFVNRFFEMTKEKPLSEGDLLKFQFVLNKFMITNEKERVEMVVASEEIISQKTYLANHPWVEDVEKEIIEIEAEPALNSGDTASAERVSAKIDELLAKISPTNGKPELV